jgi:hypothetical protein
MDMGFAGFLLLIYLFWQLLQQQAAHSSYVYLAW